MLSIERMVMRERAVCKTARDRTLLQYSAIRVLGFCRVISPPAGGAGGSELSGRSRPGASAEGRGRTGASGGAGGGCAVSPWYRRVIDIKERTEVEQTELCSFAPDIDEVSKLQL